ncbi:lamin tail domain-containing protein [Halospeciosus flavus]|uniref:Lamin tail domain-containing protein n=1 Tax=Halospeciosus flavus TaxID=3032283 RepID=A0ABD5Z0H1_9EURY|nr:lamin tail domain-containing protein [Halospeciosus flavus]
MTPPDSLPEADVSRRELLGGVGALAAGFGGGVVFNGGAVFPSRKLPPYVARQGKLRWELHPLSYKDWTVGEFYDYRPQGGQSADFPLDLSAVENASRIFVYDGPVDDSVAFYHGSAEARSGGTAFFKFSGFSRSKGEWAVRDDTMGVDDDFEKWEGGNSKVKWQWGPHETDGGAYWGTVGEKKVKIYPKTLRGVDSWRLLSQTSAGVRRIELDQSNPLYIESPKRPVRTVEMDVMPDDPKNVFDPYAKGRITVVLQPGAEADPKNIDPGNVSIYFGSRAKLASGSGAQPQKYYEKDGKLYLEFKLQSAGFELDSDDAYLTTKSKDGAWIRGRDAINPGGVDGGAAASRPLSLYGYSVDATGDDSTNLDGEWVELKNTSGGPLDLTGWTISDTDTNTYTFPEGFTLPAGESVRVHSGSGTDGTNHLYWGASKPIWQNGGDRIVVRNPQNEAVIFQVYPSG